MFFSSQLSCSQFLFCVWNLFQIVGCKFFLVYKHTGIMGFFLPSFSHLLRLKVPKLPRQTSKIMSRSPCPRSLCDSRDFNQRMLYIEHPQKVTVVRCVERKLPEANPRGGWNAEPGGLGTGRTPNFSGRALPLLCRLPRIKPRNIKTTTFLILVHRLIFPKSVMTSESLPNASPAASQTEVKVPLCLNSRVFIQATVCSVVHSRAPHVCPCGWRESQPTNR